MLAELGGLEIAALAGFIVGGAAMPRARVVDGVIACAALLVAASVAPGPGTFVIAGHRSVEPGASAALAHVGLEPLLDLRPAPRRGHRRVPGPPPRQAAARLANEMATFDAAGVADKQQPG